MTKLRAESEILSSWKGDASKPIVSICCACYNHAEFVGEALSGFLIQQTNFPFEVLIHDDASTDNSAEIIKEYQAKYPLIIKPIFQTENQYSKGVKVGQTVIPYIKAEYVAICEGDDYWLDPHKLQIQVDFLEQNPEFVVSGHDAFTVDVNGQVITSKRLPPKHKRNFSGDELVKGIGWLPNMSRLYRNVLTEFPVERTFVKTGDKFALSILGLYGKSKYHEDIEPAAYRVHQGGVWSLTSKKDRLDAQINTHFWLYKYYSRIREKSYAEYYWRKYLAYVLRASDVSLIFKVFISRLIRWTWKSKV